jgi:S1-C subfamily serine protease
MRTRNALTTFIHRMMLVLALAALPATGSVAWASGDPLQSLLPEERSTIRVFQEVADSVVFVVNRGVQRDFFSGRATEYLRGTGSGLVWDQKGHIVTNYHVVQGSTAISVVINNQEYEARILGAEPKRDIAVLKIDIEPKELTLKPVKLGSDDGLMVGQKVLAIGSPYGLDRTLTTGVISALGREIVGVGKVTIPDMIQTDASINPGNSGGPLLDSSGRLIGINTMIYSKSGASAGIGFAVPVRFVRRIVPQIIANGKAVTPVLGVSLFDDDVSRRLGLQGILIRKVVPQGGAAQAGLRGTERSSTGRIVLGDIIIGIDKRKVQSYDDLFNALDSYTPGDEVTVHYLRNGRKHSCRVRLSAL